MSQAYGTAKEIYYNVEQMCLCDSGASPLRSGYTRLALFAPGLYVLKAAFLKNDASASDVWSGQVTFWGGIKNVYTKATEAMVDIAQEAINVAGDWVVESAEQAEPEDGKLSIRVDLSGADVETALGTSEYVDCDLEIHGVRYEETATCSVLRIPLRIYNYMLADA